MPTFCRHNRFVERCPICSNTLPGNEPKAASTGGARAARAARSGSGPARAARGGPALRVRREGRAAEDGYESSLVPGLKASADAVRLAQELAFSSARLIELATDPPGSYGRARELAAAGETERASWICFLAAYLCPGDGEDAFAGVERALELAPSADAQTPELAEAIEQLPLGPRSSHAAGQGMRTLAAYAQWIARSGGSQREAFTGDPQWPPARRFARLFERLALPGLTRAARYELLVTLGRLDCFELSAESLCLTTARGGDDETTLAAKRIFGIADAMLLDRRSEALAAAVGVPLEALDLALANWGATRRASMGSRVGAPAFEQIADALGVSASTSAE